MYKRQIIDALNHIPEHSDDFGYQVLITADAAFFLVGALLLIPLKTTGRENIAKDADQLQGQ